MSPSPSGAQRNTGAGPPAKRFAWYCPLGCKPRNVPMGYGQNAHAAYLAGVRHYELAHCQADTPRQSNA